jgi:hypothetical protein
MRVRSVLTRIYSFAAILSLLLLGACVSTDRTPKLVRTASIDFQKSFSDMSFNVLPAEERVRLEINAADPRFNFTGGISYYEALVLPDLIQPYILQIDSEVIWGKPGYAGTLFFPVVTFLNENKEWLKTFDALPYVVQKRYGNANYMTVSLQISDELAAAHYIVIHTQDDKLNKAIGYHDGEALLQSSGFNTMMIAPVEEPRYRYEFVPLGWVRLKASLTSGHNTNISTQ